MTIKPSVTLLVVLAYTFLTPDLSAEVNLGERQAFSGFSIMLPDHDDWVLEGKNRNGIKVSIKKSNASNVLSVSLRTWPEPLDSLEQLKEGLLNKAKKKDSKYKQPGQRYKEYRSSVSKIKIDEIDCVKWSSFFEDHGAASYQGPAFVNDDMGIYCPHPKSKWRYVLFIYGQFYQKDEGPLISVQAIQRAFESIRFESLDEEIIYIPNENRTYYINTNSDHICYSFSLIDEWEPADEYSALTKGLRNMYAGVLLVSEKEIKSHDGKDLVSRAAADQLEFFEKLQERPADSSEVEVFESSIPGSIKWTAKWEFKKSGQTYYAQVVRYYAEVKPGWVAAVTAPAINYDGYAQEILKSLTVKSEPNCYQEWIQTLNKKRDEPFKYEDDW